MASDQSPVQQPSLQLQVSQLEQRVKLLEQRLQGVFSAKAVRSEHFEIMDNNEVRRAILALSDDQKTISLRLFNKDGKAIVNLTERFDGGAELFLMDGAAQISSVILKATKDDSQAFFQSAAGRLFVLEGHLQLLTKNFKKVAELGTDASGETDLRFFSEDGKVVADIGTNGLGGGSVNVNSTSGFVNLRSDSNGSQIFAHNNNRGAVTLRVLDANPSPTLAINDKDGEERIVMTGNVNTAQIQLHAKGESGTVPLVGIFAADGTASISGVIGNKGAGFRLDANAAGGQLGLLHRNVADEFGRRSIELDTQGSTPSISVSERRDACSVRPTEVAFIKRDRVVAQLPETLVDEEGDGGNTSDGNTLTMSLGERKTVNDGPRGCPNPVFGGKFHPLGDVRDHYIEVLCEVTHPTIDQVKNDVIDCARNAAIAAGIVAVAVAVVTEGSAASASFSAAVATFKVSFKQCLVSKGVDIASELTPKISTRNRFGEWSGH